MMRHRSRFIRIPLLGILLIGSDIRAEEVPAELSFAAYAGIWILDPAPQLSFPDCQLMVRVDALEGSIYRVLSCEADKTQVEIQMVTSFAENSVAGWAATPGFQIEASPQISSCIHHASYTPSGLTYSFDHSLGLISGSSEASFFMSSPIGEELGNFRSGSTVPDLGKNKDCRAIISRSRLPSQATNVLLQKAAWVCELTPDVKGLGCFTQVDAFVPAHERGPL